MVVLLDSRRAVEVLVEDKVVVAFEGMSVDNGIGVVVFAEELLQVECSLGKEIHREGDILDEAGGTNLACTAHSREDT